MADLCDRGFSGSFGFGWGCHHREAELLPANPERSEPGLAIGPLLGDT